jgi:GT2 family glycosyltransferase
MSRTAFVIVNYNTGPFLVPYVESIRRQDGSRDAEVLVVDCASPLDQGAHLAQAERLGARVLRSADNLGYAGACNLGLRETSGDYVVFSNADIQLLNDVVTTLTR